MNELLHVLSKQHQPSQDVTVAHVQSGTLMPLVRDHYDSSMMIIY